MECRRCAACDQAFRPRAQSPDQRYCGLAACQRERRRRWQRSKRHSDADYRANQRRRSGSGPLVMAITGANGEPSRLHRSQPPGAASTRGDRQVSRLAKMDASTPINPVASGTYRLVPATGGDLAKKDAWTVKITVISTVCDHGEADTILQREDVIGTAGPPC